MRVKRGVDEDRVAHPRRASSARQGEPETAPLSLAMQILKQRFSKTRVEEFVWEPRYYDFNVRTEKKRIEKLKYIHRNPVRDGLADEADQWRWSSFRAYAYLEDGPVKITRA